MGDFCVFFCCFPIFPYYAYNIIFFRSKVPKVEGWVGKKSGIWRFRPEVKVDSIPLAGVMWLEILLASVLGFVIYWFVSKDKEETLPLEDGWWGPGVRPTAGEDESIRPFKVETSDEEINVRHLFPEEGVVGRAGRSLLGLRLRLGLGWGGSWEVLLCGGGGVFFHLLFSHWALPLCQPIPSAPSLPCFRLPLPKAPAVPRPASGCLPDPRVTASSWFCLLGAPPETLGVSLSAQGLGGDHE